MARRKAVVPPYKVEGEEFTRVMVKARLSPREVAYRFGRPEDKIRDMMEGKVKPDLVILRGMGA